MQRGYLYFVLALAALVAGVFVPWLWLKLLLFWLAVASAYFGVGYVTGYGEILLKSRRGRVPLPIKIVIGPVLLGATLYNWYWRNRDPNPPIQKVREGLYLGRRLFSTDKPLLEEYDIGAILDVTVEFDALGSKILADQINYYNIPIFDRAKPRLSQLNKAVHWIEQQRKEGRNVIIHCALGQGRSVSVLLAYLCVLEPQRGLQDLLKSVQEIRGSAEPNAHQLRMVERFREMDMAKQQLRAVLIFNPAAGQSDSEQDLRAIREALEPFLDLEVRQTQPEHSDRKLAHEAVDSGADLVIAAGGDGTISAVAYALGGTGVPMGIIPRGTVNALSKSLFGMGEGWNTIERCCERILSGFTREIDLAEAGDQCMVLLGGIGMEAGLVERADRANKDQWGALAYLMGGWESLTELPLMDVTLTVDGETHRFRAGSVVVANAAPLTSVLAQGAGAPDPADGLLDVTAIVDVADRAEAVRLMADLFARGLGVAGDLSDDAPAQQDKDGESEKIRHYRGREIRLEPDPPERLVVDGERAGETPVTFRTCPKALKIIVDEPEPQPDPNV